jgi:hypothetical protein
MINPFKEVDWSPDLSQRRSFAKSLIIGFPCVAVVLLLAGWMTGKGWNVPQAVMIGGIGAAVGALFFLVPSIARPFYVAWYFLACCIGLVVGNLLLAFVYYTVVTVTGLILRASGWRAIRKTVDRTAETYWHDAEPTPEPQQYYRQY